MTTINTNFLPASTGLTLGNSNQRWNASLVNLDSSGKITVNQIGGVSQFNNIVYAIAGESVASAIARLPVGGGTVIFDEGVYPSGNVTIQTPNITLQGAGMPGYNANYTALTGGTIIQGPLSVIQGGDHVVIKDLGVDVGTTWATASNSGNATNALAIYNSGQLVPGTPVQAPIIRNVACLGFSSAAAFHCMLVENVNDAYVENIATVYNQHGLVIKGTNVTVNGSWNRGHGLDSIIVKSDNYAPTSGVNISNFQCSYLTSVGDGKGIIIQGVSSGLNNVNLTNGIIKGAASFGIQLQGQSVSNFCTAVNLSNITIDYTTPSPANYYAIQYLQYTSNVNMSNINVFNYWAGIAPSSPVLGATNDFGITTSRFVNITTNAIEAYGRWNVSNCGFVGITSTAILADALSTVAYTNNIFSSVGTNFSGTGSLLFEGISTLDTSNNITFPANVISGSGVYGSSGTVTVTVLSTPTTIITNAISGMLRLRDNTLGGGALFLIDPNGGSQLLGTSQITGLASAAGITFASGAWKVSLSSGAVPRVLTWTIYA